MDKKFLSNYHSHKAVANNNQNKNKKKIKISNQKKIANKIKF